MFLYRETSKMRDFKKFQVKDNTTAFIITININIYKIDLIIFSTFNTRQKGMCNIRHLDVSLISRKENILIFDVNMLFPILFFTLCYIYTIYNIYIISLYIMKNIV